MSEKTAIEWLVDQLRTGKKLDIDLIEQSKKIEKLQMINFHIGVLKKGLAGEGLEQTLDDTAEAAILILSEQLYQETYGD